MGTLNQLDPVAEVAKLRAPEPSKHELALMRADDLGLVALPGGAA